MSTNTGAWMEGVISIEAAIRSGNRAVQAIYIGRHKWSRTVEDLIKLAESSSIPVLEADDRFIRDQASGNSHGGVIGLVGDRQFMELGELAGLSENPLVVMLDGIEDPFNFGQTVRALYSAGVDGMVVRPRNWLSAAGVVARASAGASELMPMAVADDVVTAAAVYRKLGMKIACTAKKGSVSLYETDLTAPLFLLIGGEKRGITRSFSTQADLRLRIPYQRHYRYALGAAASAAIIGFEIMRQRHFCAD